MTSLSVVAAPNAEKKNYTQIQKLIKSSVCNIRGEGFSYVFKSEISEDRILVDYACPRKLRIKTVGALIPNIEFVTNGNEAWRALPAFPDSPSKERSALVEHFWSLKGFDFSLLFEVFPPLRTNMQPYQLENHRQAQEQARDAHNFNFYTKGGFQWVELTLAGSLLPPYRLIFKFSLGSSELKAIHVDIHKMLEHIKFKQVSLERKKRFPELRFNPRVSSEHKVTYYPKRK